MYLYSLDFNACGKSLLMPSVIYLVSLESGVLFSLFFAASFSHGYASSCSSIERTPFLVMDGLLHFRCVYLMLDFCFGIVIFNEDRNDSFLLISFFPFCLVPFVVLSVSSVSSVLGAFEEIRLLCDVFVDSTLGFCLAGYIFCVDSSLVSFSALLNLHHG